MPQTSGYTSALAGSRLGEAILFLALFATALALGGALAHLYALPNKIDLPQEDYFIAQKAYRGWNQLAYVLLAQLAAIAASLWRFRRQRRVFRPALVAATAWAAAQAIFWIFTAPANRATENWTESPENWEILRRQWEYSHAVGAGFQLIVLAALLWAAFAYGRRGRSER